MHWRTWEFLQLHFTFILILEMLLHPQGPLSYLISLIFARNNKGSISWCYPSFLSRKSGCQTILNNFFLQSFLDWRDFDVCILTKIAPSLKSPSSLSYSENTSFPLNRFSRNLENVSLSRNISLSKNKQIKCTFSNSSQNCTSTFPWFVIWKIAFLVCEH